MHAPPAPAADRSRLLLALVLLLTAITYAGTLRYGFVYDDGGQIVANPIVQSWRFAPRYLVEHMWSNQVNVPPNYYRPLFLLWCLLNYSVFGLREAGWHATTVLLHLVVTWLVWRMARRLGFDEFGAAAAAAIFGVHPIHLESVAWISGVTDPLLAVFYVGAFLLYVRGREKSPHERNAGLSGPPAVALAAVLYLLAMFSKETGIVLPLALLAYEAIVPESPLRERVRGIALRMLPFVAAAALYLALRYHALRGIGHPVVELPARVFPLTWPLLLWFYVRKLFWPVGLSPFYDTPYVLGADAKLFWLPLAALAGSAAAFWLWWRTLERRSPLSAVRSPVEPQDAVAEGGKRIAESASPRRVALFALAWIVIPLLPVLDIVSLEPHEIAHDRYLYLSSIGFALLMALAIERLPAARRELFGRPATRVGTVLVLIAFLTVASIQQSIYWANDLLLFYRATSIAPASRSARNNLANALLERGYYEDGIRIHLQILRGDPDYWLSYYNLGNAYYKLGRYADAEQAMFRAAALNSINPQLFLYLGMVQLKQNELPQAEHNVREAIRIWPRGVGARYVLGLILEQEGRPVDAAQQFEDELKLEPDQPKVRAELEKLRSP